MTVIGRKRERNLIMFQPDVVLRRRSVLLLCPAPVKTTVDKQ